ncbi:MAG: hypothetical protein ABWK01_06670 [Infirmifilum sp.]
MSSYALAFALGLLYGRRAAAQVEQVEPELSFLPPLEVEQPPPGDLSALADQLVQAGVPREVALRFLEGLKELGSLREYAEALERVEKYSYYLRSASRALEEGRISPAAFQFVVRRYMRLLSSEYPKLESLRGRVDEDVKKLLAQLLSPAGGGGGLAQPQTST